MNGFVLVLLLFLTNGTPLPNFFVIPPGHPCNATVASTYARDFVAPSLGEGFSIQDPDKTGLHLCLPIIDGPGPGPADPGFAPPDDGSTPLPPKRNS